MQVRPPATRLLALAAALGFWAGEASAQNPGCAQVLASSQTVLPQYSGTLPGSGDISLGGGTSYLYILTQWGMARASVADPLNPGPFTQVVIGKEGGSNNGGVIPILCDCHQGGNTMDVVEGPGNDSRMISDWQPFAQGQGQSGLAAQVAKTIGDAGVQFGDQINLSSYVPGSARIAAVYLPASAKYFGYFPTASDNVQKVDLTTTNGLADPGSALQPTAGIGWSSAQSAVRLRATHLVAGSYDQYVLVGTTRTDSKLHIAEISQANGSLTEVATGDLQSWPIQFDVGVVNNRIFIVSADGSAGINLYEFTPPNLIQHVGGISGTYLRAFLRGPAGQPFPGLFVHRSVSGSESYIDVYDTKWFTQGGSPLLAKSLRHFGASDPFHGSGFEVLVQSGAGGTLTAYLYRELGGYPLGSLHTDKIDISCIAADPNAPPIPFAVMTNLSAQARGGAVTNYYGDKWSIADASVSYVPITELDWDFHYTGSFVPEKIQVGANLGGFTYNPAYWPCDLLSGGDITTGSGCYQSLGTPASTYQVGLNAKNSNGPGAAPYISSPPIAVVAPQISIVGYNGNNLQVLAGNPGNGDASGSQGNTSDATFAWTFTPTGTASGTIVTVPTTATAFALTATYKGGYATSKAGTVSQVDLVPNFSLTPNPVLKGTALTLRNLQQISAAATITAPIAYAITPGGAVGDLPTSFKTTGATATVTAPATAGSYTITLTWTYTDHTGATRTAQASQPFTAIDFTPVPSLGVYKNADHTQSVPSSPLNPPTWGLTQGTTYYLFDDETIPGGAGSHPGAAFYKSTDSNQSIGGGDTQLAGSPSTGYGPATFPASAVCSNNCYFKIQVPAGTGTVRAFRYSVTGGGGGCSPNCPPPPASVTLLTPSPAAPNVGQAVTFTASAQNYTPTTFQWDFGDGGGSGGGGGQGCPPGVTCATSALVAGPNPNTHTYTTAGTYIVTVQATGGATTKSASQSITVAPGGPPTPLYTISGASLGAGNRYEAVLGRTVTFTSLEPAAAGVTWNWDFGDGSTASGQVVTHAFLALGSPNVALNVTNSYGTSGAAIGFTVLDASVLYLGNRRYEVRAAWSSSRQGTSGTGTAVNLTSDTGYFWFFSPSNLEVVAKVLDACAGDGYIWVFAGGLTNLHVDLTVTDTQTGAVKTYTNTEDTPFAPIQDTRFEACPVITGAAAVPAPKAATATPTVTLSAPTPANPIEGDTVSFTATPVDFTGTVSYLWDFGDSCPPVVPGCTGGAAAGPATNTHKYVAAGTYAVKVTATAGAQQATATQTLIVSPVSTTPRPSVAYTIAGASLSGGRWQAQVDQPIMFTAAETHGTFLWDFGDGVTSTANPVTHSFTAAGNPNVTLTVTGIEPDTSGTSAVTIRFTISDPFSLYLNAARFAVRATWTSGNAGTNGDGIGVPLSTDTGTFWFFSPTNTEVVVKVLDACAVDGHFWIFASGLTNLGVQLEVTDLTTGTTRTYENADGSPFQPIQDFTTFVACQ